MATINFNSIPMSALRINAAQSADGTEQRANFISAGRLLAYEFAVRGKIAIDSAFMRPNSAQPTLKDMQYKALNEKFQQEHLLYAAQKVSTITGQPAPKDYDEFKRMSQNYYGNEGFYRVLQGIYQEIITPILPAVYSTAVDTFAEVVEVGFGETYTVSVDSNDIPIFQDSAWGASRSVPRNRFYAKDYTLNPQPKTAMITAKWMQLVGNGMDFGRFFANLAAGMYAKTMGVWNSALQAAVTNTALIPAGLSVTFNSPNWVSLANKISALNAAPVSNLMAYGNLVALSKVLPTQTTGSTNLNMDAAIATLLGADYTRSGYLGEFMAVRLMPLIDAVVPGTQNSEVKTVLNPNQVIMMANNRLKPFVIAYNSATPITIEMDPTKTGDFEIGINLTMALDSVAVFGSRIGLVTVA